MHAWRVSKYPRAREGTVMSTQIDQHIAAAPTPQQLGVGMRFSLHPHTDDFVDVILRSGWPE